MVIGEAGRPIRILGARGNNRRIPAPRAAAVDVEPACVARARQPAFFRIPRCKWPAAAAVLRRRTRRQSPPPDSRHTGWHDSGKSTAAQLIRTVIDPNSRAAPPIPDDGIESRARNGTPRAVHRSGPSNPQSWNLYSYGRNASQQVDQAAYTVQNTGYGAVVRDNQQQPHHLREWLARRLRC